MEETKSGAGKAVGAALNPKKKGSQAVKIAAALLAAAIALIIGISGATLSTINGGCGQTPPADGGGISASEYQGKLPGIAGQVDPVVGKSAKTGVTFYGGPQDPGTPGSTGGSGIDLKGRYAWAELTPGASFTGAPGANAFGKLLGLDGPMPYGTKIQVTFKDGKVATVQKLDVGAGGAPTEGKSKSVDLWHEVTDDAGVTGPGKSAGWSAALDAEAVEPDAKLGMAKGGGSSSSEETTTASPTEDDDSDRFADQASDSASQPETDASTPDFSEAIKAAKAAKGSPVGFAVVDSSGKTIAEYKGTAKNTGRSISKSLILVALTQKAKGRELTASEKSLATRMIEDSDNEAANTLLDEVGKAAVNKAAVDAGMKQWNADAGMGKSIAFKLGTASVSAEDFARFFVKIDTMLATKHRDFAVDLLANIKGAGRYGVLDAGYDGKVLSKGGWNVDGSEGTVNQAAQVNVDGDKYGISVVLGDQTSLEAGGKQIATIATAVRKALPDAGGSTQPAVKGCAAGDTEPASGDGGEIVKVATGEIGKTESGGAPAFYNGYDPWCMFFASWVWAKAGIQVDGKPYPTEAYSGMGATHAISQGKKWGTYVPGNDVSRIPPGSLVMWGSSPTSSDHVAIVTKVLSATSFEEIGGNQSGACGVTCGVYRQIRSTAGVYGFVIPPGMAETDGPNGGGKSDDADFRPGGVGGE